MALVFYSLIALLPIFTMFLFMVMGRRPASEGASGFGTAAVICVPLLVAEGFSAMAAVSSVLR